MVINPEYDFLAYIGIGVILTILYCFLGIGTVRAVMKAQDTEFSLFYVALWPIVLLVFAARGEVAQ